MHSNQPSSKPKNLQSKWEKKLAKNGELAQIKTTEDVGTTVVMEGEVASKTVAEAEIDDDFIDNI